MKKKLTNNLALKIVSVLVAMIIWLFASNASDPVITEDYSVKVNAVNDDYIIKSGKTYRIADENRSVMVYIKGKTSVVSRRNDISVEADMTQIVEMNKNSNLVYVPVQFKPVAGISMKDVQIYPKTIPVYIEEVESKDFVITVNTTGKPGTGYEIGECTSSLEKVRIQGPKSKIGIIKSVLATVNVTGVSSDTKKTAQITIVDQNGKPFTEDEMEYLNIFEVGPERTVDVSVDLWKIVDDVKVKANYSGTPAYGYQVDKVITTPETISVAGSDEALEELAKNNNTIEIPASLINVEGTTRDQEANVKLNSLLKEEDGFKVPADLTQSVLVKVSILPYGSKEFEVKTSDIEIRGLASDMRLIFNQEALVIRVKATDADLETLKPEEIKASVDLTDKVAGEYTLPVSVVLPDGYEQVEHTVTTVQLTKNENTDE